MPEGTTANHQSVIIEWEVRDPTNLASVVDPTSHRELLRIDQPQFNHDAGAINIDLDGNLYIALGDGGSRDDEGVGHGASGNGQDFSNVLGAILRIDPLGSNSSNGQYGIPADNPFVGLTGFVDELFAYGFRNPYRISFDMETGVLVIGDVGENDIEEIDVITSGGNYGWNVKEGSFCFDPNGGSSGFAFEGTCLADTTGMIDPVAEYNTADSLSDNIDGRSVIGGFVYRGSNIPKLFGRYVFGDFSRFTESGINNDGRLFFLRKRNLVEGDAAASSKIKEFKLFGQDNLGKSLLGFGQDSQGEIYVMANDTGVPFGTGPNFDVPTGVVLRIDPSPLKYDVNLDGSQEVLPVTTNAAGTMTVKFNGGLTRAKFNIKVLDGDAVTEAHLHCAPAGTNGPVVAFLSGFVPGGFDVDGKLAKFVLKDTNIAAVGADCIPTAGMAINNIADLAQAMHEGNIYVNVHTVVNPSGDIRGQLADVDG